MASSGRMTGDSIGNGNYIYIDWDLDSQSVSGNSSKISWSAYYHFNLSDAQLDNGNAYLSGSRWDNGGRVYNYSGNISTRNLKLASGSFTLGHNSDGTKTLSVSGAISEYGAGTSNGSKSFSLPTIPRGAVFTSTETNGWSEDDDLNLTIDNPANGYVRIDIGTTTSSDSTVWCRRDLGRYDGAVTITPTDAELAVLYAAHPNEASFSVDVEMRTYTGSGYTGQLGNSVSFNAPFTVINANPTFDDPTPLTYADTNSATVAVTGDNQLIVQNISDLVATITGATAKKSATIVNYKVTVGNETQTVTSPGAVDFDTVDLIENTPITVTVTDSRGYTATFSRTVSILAWQPPRAVVSASRVNNYEDNTTVKADVTIDSLSGTNAIQSLKVKYKKTTDVTWSQKSITSGVEDTITIDKLYQWNVQFEIIDKFGTTTYNLLISKGIPIMFIDNQQLNMGISKFPAAGRILDVGGDIYMNDRKVRVERPCAFRMSNAANDMNPAAGAKTKIKFDTVDWDYGSNITGSAGSRIFTAPWAGLYHFDAQYLTDQNAEYCQIYVYKNGVITNYANAGVNLNGVGSSLPDWYQASLSVDIDLAAGETIEVYVEVDDSSTLQQSGARYNWFNGHFVMLKP